MKQVPRSPWIALHRYLGIAAIPLLGFAALTGSVLAFMRPLDTWLNADLFFQTPAVSAGPVVELVENFQRSNPGWEVRSFPLSVALDERIPVMVSARKGPDGEEIDQVFLDRATGAIAGSRSAASAWDRRGAMELLHDLHYTLLGGDWGRWVMGGMAVLWLIGHCIGFYLTFPLKRPFWKGWKRSWKVSFKSMFGRFMLDWHKASALWLFVPLTALALTSVGLNFFGEAYGPVVEAIFGDDEDVSLPGPPQLQALSFTEAVGKAKILAASRGIDWRPATVINNPEGGTIGVTLTDDGKLNYHRLGPIYYYFDRRSHSLIETYDPYHGNRALAAYRVLYPLHSGRVGGNFTILLVFASGLATFGLCVTGIYVWWKKRTSRVAARRSTTRQLRSTRT